MSIVSARLDWSKSTGICCSRSFFLCGNCSFKQNIVSRYDAKKKRSELIQENETKALLYLCFLPFTFCCQNTEYGKYVKLELRKVGLDFIVRTKFYSYEKTDIYHNVTALKVEPWEADEFNQKSVAITVTYGKRGKHEIVKFHGAEFDEKFDEFNKYTQLIIESTNTKAYDISTRRFGYQSVGGRLVSMRRSQMNKLTTSSSSYASRRSIETSTDETASSDNDTLPDPTSVPKYAKGSSRINDPMEEVKEESELEEQNYNEQELGEDTSDSREDEADLEAGVTYDYNGYLYDSHETFGLSIFAQLYEDKDDGLHVSMTREEARALSSQKIDRL